MSQGRYKAIMLNPMLISKKKVVFNGYMKPCQSCNEFMCFDKINSCEKCGEFVCETCRSECTNKSGSCSSTFKWLCITCECQCMYITMMLELQSEEDEKKKKKNIVGNCDICKTVIFKDTPKWLYIKCTSCQVLLCCEHTFFYQFKHCSNSKKPFCNLCCYQRCKLYRLPSCNVCWAKGKKDFLE